MEPLPGCVVGVREDVLKQHNIKSEEFYLGGRSGWGLGHEHQCDLEKGLITVYISIYLVFLVQGAAE